MAELTLDCLAVWGATSEDYPDGPEMFMVGGEHLLALIEYAREKAARKACEEAPPCADDDDRAGGSHAWDVSQLLSPHMNGTRKWWAIAHCTGRHKGWAPSHKGEGDSPTEAYLALRTELCGA